MTPFTNVVRIVLIVTALGSAAVVGGQVLPFQVLGLVEGLPQSQAAALAQDTEGYVWVGTWGGGLARFNGAGFTTFMLDDGLPSSRIQELLLGRDGRMWVATTGGVAVWSDHRLAPVDLGPGTGMRVRALAEDADGGLWLGGDRGVVVIGPEGPRSVPLGTPEPIVYDLLVEPEGMLAVTDRGLLQLSGDGRVRELAPPPVAPDDLRAAVRTGDGLWLGTSSEGLLLLDDAGWHRVAADRGVSCRNVYRLTVGRSGTLYVASQDDGLLLKPPSERAFEQIGTARGLPAKIVNDALEDAEGSLWVATDIGGVARLRSRAATIHGTDGSFPSPCVFGISAGAEAGTIWLATLAGAVHYRARPPFGVLETLTEEDGLVDPHVWGIVELETGELWVYTESFYQVRRAGRMRFEPPSSSDPIPRNTHGLAVDGQGRMWFSGQDVEHPLAVREPDGQWRSWRTADDGTPLPDCRSAAPRRAGGVWVSAGADLLVCDGAGVRRVPGPPLPPGLTALLEDSIGRLWVGNEGGLAVRDTNGRWRRMGPADGFTARQVFFLGQDRSGTVWVGVERGVLRFLPDGRVLPFGTEDGLAGLETNQFGFLAGADGEVWLGTVAGVTRFDPSRWAPLSRPPRLVVEAAELPGRTVAFPQHLELRWSERSVTFKIALPSYRDRSQIAYRARLEGLDDGWLPPRRSAELRYTNLPAGEHALLLEPVVEGGGSGEVIRLPVTVVPPLWHRGWVQGGAVLALLMAAVGLHRVRLRMLRQRADELERVVGERTDELRSANRKLAQLASRDALTQLPNRRAIFGLLEDQLASGSRRLGCLLIDLDRFKEVNDALGHAAGDQVLCTMADRIAASLRDNDVVGRYGGDEFLAVLPGSDLEAVEAVARRIASLQVVCPVDNGTVTVSVSCGGVAVSGESPRDVAAVLAAADRLLYEVKAQRDTGYRVTPLTAGASRSEPPPPGEPA
jgi:diguanylate cyclase (GGDEF)-like protein